jgi:uncharacterized protein YjbK
MASDGVELELKWALDADGHAALARRLPELLGQGHELRQDNRFCDCADGRLRAKRMSIRLRRENDRLVLTCKSRGAVSGDGLHSHDEFECELPAAWWAQADVPQDLDLPLPDAWREVLAGAPLISLGGFANLRLEFHDGPHLLCLDRTDFGGRVDHELEIETPDPSSALPRWRTQLASWGVAWAPQPLTKLHRFLQRAG